MSAPDSEGSGLWKIPSVDSGPGWTGSPPASQCLHSRNTRALGRPAFGARTADRHSSCAISPVPPTLLARCCPLLSSSALSRPPPAAVIIKVALHPVIALPLLIDLVTCWPFLVRDAHIGAVWCVRVECGVLVWAVSTFVIVDPCALECSTNM